MKNSKHFYFKLTMGTKKILACLSFIFAMHSFFAQKIFSVDYANQANIKVFVVDYENQSDLLVYKVSYENQVGKNDGLWFFTKYANQADKKVFFVEYANQADLKICFVKYQNRAGWRSKEKMYLLY